MSDWREYEKRSGGQVKAAAWRAMHRPCVAFEEVAKPDGAAVGASKVGGEPDLPEAFAWPSVEGQPLHFVAQFDLREVSDAAWREPDFRASLALPTAGLLSLFHDPVSAIVQVHHFTVPLASRSAKGGALPECFVRAVLAPELALPSLDDAAFEELTDTARAWLAELYAADGRATRVDAQAQLGGYTNTPIASRDVCFMSTMGGDLFVTQQGELHRRETVRTARPPQRSITHRLRNLLALHGQQAVQQQLRAMGASPEASVEFEFHGLLLARTEEAQKRGRETLYAWLKDEA